ncbi:MAG: hypothetical protein ISP54_02185 [Flavobacteriales bacterium]|jgi:polyferredoxin|nr:hypothetical protein [Flavobacteriales bacterium]
MTEASIIFEILGWWLLSFLKFIVMPSAGLAAGMAPLRVFTYSASGAILGLLLMQPVIRVLFDWRSQVRRKKGKRAFTPGRRRIVRIKQHFGILGIAFLGGPLGVPVGALLAFKYFGHRSSTLPIMMVGYVMWSALLTTLSALAFH